MNFYFHPIIAYGYPEPIFIHERSENAWKIYMICLAQTEKSSLIYKDRLDIEKIYHSAINNLFSTLLINTSSGQDLSVHYHKEGDIHPALSVSYKDFKGASKKQTVFRIRQGDLRLYFIYRSKRTIILLKLMVKHTDDLTDSKKNYLSKLASIVLKMKDPDDIENRILHVREGRIV